MQLSTMSFGAMSGSVAVIIREIWPLLCEFLDDEKKQFLQPHVEQVENGRLALEEVHAEMMRRAELENSGR